MKTSNLLLLFFALTPLAAPAQVGNSPALGNQPGAATSSLPAPTAFRVVARGPDTRVWQRETYAPGPAGQIQTRTHSFTEVSTGLHYETNGQWVETKELIELQPNGTAAATQGRHKVFFPGNIARGFIHIVTREGQHLKSRPLGLSYDDGSQTVLLAELKDSTGMLAGSNQVVYPDCFVGLKAALRFTYKKGSVEQDVILQEQPDEPTAYGLNAASTKLQVLTEFFGAPSPTIKRHAPRNGAGAADTELRFGNSIMGRGRAFMFGADSRRGLPSAQDLPVTKSWETIQGRTFLIEELPMAQAKTAMRALPRMSGNYQPGHESKLCQVSPTRWLPAARMTEPDNARMQLAGRAEQPTQGFVLDYVLLDTIVWGDLTLQADMTYLISGTVDVVGTLTIEGGTVVKYNLYENTDSMSIIQCWSNVVCATARYRPAVFTYAGDGTVGEDVGIYGAPDYSYQALYINDDATPLANLRISYAGYALHDHSLILKDSQIVNCYYGIISDWWGWVGDYNSYLTNVLMANVQIPLQSDWGSTWHGCHITIAGCQQLCQDLYVGSSTMTFVNSLLVGVTNYGAATVITNYTASPADNSVFQVVGAGSYYLATNSPYRNVGTTNLDLAMLAGLAAKTTYPPIVYLNTAFTNATTFAPQALRDSDLPDLGYHYDSLDFVFGACDVHTNLTFAAGTAVGLLCEYGSAVWDPCALALNDGAIMNSAGTVDQPCWLVRPEVVQEGGNANWTPSGWMVTIALNGSGAGAVPRLTGEFTKYSSLANMAGNFQDYWAYGIASHQHCEFYSSNLGSYRSWQFFTNCLFFRNCIAFWDQRDAATLTFQNCTFYNGGLALCRYDGQSSSFWTIINTTFDGTAFIWDDNLGGNTNSTQFDYNAYSDANTSWLSYPYFGITPAGTLETTGPHDVTVANGYEWLTSWFGDFYLPADSPLIAAGSTTADAVGLYHFTTQVSQVKESNSVVDIGYHYGATDDNGNPFDSNGDGIPDYLEDANGNGIVDNGELGWNWADPRFHVWITQPSNNNSIP